MQGLNFKKDLWSILTLAGLITLFFAQVLFTDKSFVFRDYYRYFYPTRYFAWESIRNGIIPLWNPYLYSGIPFLADLQSCIFYPPSLILYLLPFHFGLKFFCVFHFFLAGLFTYLLLRDFHLSRSASLVAAITFTFSGYLLSVVDMITSLTSAIWIPLVFLFFNRAINHSEFKWVILTGVSLGIQFLGGEPTVLYATSISLFLFAIAKGIARIQDSKANLRPIAILSLLFSPCYLLLSACVIALGLTLFQALPFLEMVSNSDRIEMSYETATHWSLAPYELFGLITPIPAIFGLYRPSYLAFTQAWLKNLYLGIIPLLLALYAMVQRRKVILFFAALSSGFILLSFGDYLPIYRLLYEYLPFFSFIRYPVKFFSLSTFALAILAGFGFHYFIKGLREEKIIWPLFIFNILYLSVFIVGYGLRKSILKLLITTWFPGLSDKEILGLASGYLQFMENIYFVAVILSLASLLIYLVKREKIKPVTFSYILITLVIVDLFYFGLGLNPLIGKEFYTSVPETLRVVKESGAPYRIMVTPKTNEYYQYLHGPTLAIALETAKSALIPNLGLRYHLFEFGGYTSLRLRDYLDFLKSLNRSFKEVQGVLSLANVRYLISHLKMEGEINLVYGQGINIYQNLTTLPRTFIVQEAMVVEDRKEVLERLFDPEFSPNKEIILEEKIKNQETEGRGKAEDRPLARIVEYQPNKVIIKTSSSRPGFLFLSDTYYPGWEAYVDGVKTKIYRANYTFRAIKLPAGEHTVEFVYRPLSFRIGVLGSTITLMALIGYGIWKKRRN